MAWNIDILCIRDQGDAASLLPDVFRRTEKELHFEEASSVMMESALAVGSFGEWTIVIDTQGRWTHGDMPFLSDLSKRRKIKTFWIAEAFIYRDYRYGIIRKGGAERQIADIEEGRRYLRSRGVEPWDEWGESIAFQLLEEEVFGKRPEPFDTTLRRIKYDKYEPD
ncbi:hypothetical protein [Saccharibacillus alkalitolerans]|uniref:Uncharacterized protein n=1 Tax=Saccharibacillus alkalitolerans TaxID=2705290 RepID=A0ABX0F7M1_9BACL|nr:hypothetical protein [Saccharibacillus alkalitolerans]NGZ76957.1 hypothetical protein [Saccharibacillus alkalitolerans]